MRRGAATEDPTESPKGWWVFRVVTSARQRASGSAPANVLKLRAFAQAPESQAKPSQPKKRYLRLRRTLPSLLAKHLPARESIDQESPPQQETYWPTQQSATHLLLDGKTPKTSKRLQRRERGQCQHPRSILSSLRRTSVQTRKTKTMRAAQPKYTWASEALAKSFGAPAIFIRSRHAFISVAKTRPCGVDS